MLQKFELQKIRDFGEIITDSFIFIRRNLLPLVKCYFIFCGFFLLASVILAAIQQGKMVSTVNSLDTFRSESSLSRTYPFSFFGIEYFLAILFAVFNNIAIHVTIYSYICLYKIKGNEPPTPEEVWGYFKFFYFKILGSGFLLALLIMVGALLCFFPGIYLGTVLSLVFPIMIFENTTLGYAFNRSFRLIKDNWWQTFGVFFVVGIIVYFASLAIIAPLTILNFSNLFIHPKGGLHISATVTIITTVLQHLCQIFYILPLVAVSLCYFSLTERLDGFGLMERITRLGSNEPDNNSPAEEY